MCSLYAPGINEIPEFIAIFCSYDVKCLLFTFLWNNFLRRTPFEIHNSKLNVENWKISISVRTITIEFVG